jgi:hypothetical protein
MAEFDQLASILFEGDVKAPDFKTMPGTATNVSRDELARSLLESMQRMGLVVDGKLTNKIQPKL